jgi:hypothetical protein
MGLSELIHKLRIGDVEISMKTGMHGVFA